MPLTKAQRDALQVVRATINNPLSLGTAESVDQRAREPEPGTVPPDVAVHVEIAPPSPRPHPLLDDTGLLKTPERVPVYFFSLRENERASGNYGNGDAATIPDSDNARTHVILYIHGGGNVVCHPALDTFINYYAHLLRAVASRSRGTAKCVVVAPSYRLATVPENTFPGALQDLLAAYDYLLAKGYEPSNITIAGDSAGGNHAIVLTHLVLQSGGPSPRGVVPIAPFSIQTHDLLSDYAKSLADDDILDLWLTEAMASAYVGDSAIARTDPLVSGTFIPFSANWPKTLVLVGSADQLIDASRQLRKRLAALGRQVELVEYDQRPHAWWVLPHIFPEDIQDSAQRVAPFILD